jgi:predicted nucleic acid-binding protein
MSAYVVDACVLIKWYIPEVHTESAVRLLDSEHDFLVPDLLYSELGSVLLKKVRKKEIPLEIAQEIIRSVEKKRFQLIPSKILLSAAFEIAHALDRSVYDSIYLAAACDRDAPLVTADQKFYNVIHRSSFKDNILWVGDF